MIAASLSATELDVRQDAPAPSPFTECFVCPDCHRCLAHEVCKCEPPDIEEPAWLQNYNPEDDLPDSEDGIATYRFD